ncbi:hypothetical protein JHK87_045399 [Glycine soja]|nr:hypothetical protein JHK87_045399 [Glycine soja]
MLVGELPFVDKEDTQNLHKTIKRITLKEIKSHPWFLKNLPKELREGAQDVYYSEENTKYPLQSIEEIMNIVNKAKTTPAASSPNLQERLIRELKKR